MPSKQPSLAVKQAAACAFEQVSLGEVMLRLDPGEGRIRTSRSFAAWEGGGEYNTSRGLRKCFGLRSAVCTALVDNEVGHLIEDCIMQGGVATEFIKWRGDDGIGRTVRNGLNFTERGFGIRGAVGVPDRGNSAASQLKPGDFDWGNLFGRLGTRWFHTGGIFAALSDGCAAVLKEALVAAKKPDDEFYAAKLVTARYYAEHVLPKTSSLAHEIQHGGPSTMALTEDQFDIDRKSLALA